MMTESEYIAKLEKAIKEVILDASTSKYRKQRLEKVLKTNEGE